MKKYAPWFIVAILIIAIGFIWFSLQKTIDQKNSENAALTLKYEQLIADVNLKAKDTAVRTTEANKKYADLKDEAAKKLSDLNEEASRKLSSAKEEADSKLAQIASEAESKLRSADRAVQAANLPEVRLTVAFRKALMNSGQVAVIKSLNPTTTAIALGVRRASTNQQKSLALVFDQGQVKEIGEREGWAFLPGDMLQFTQAGHKPLLLQVQ